MSSEATAYVWAFSPYTGVAFTIHLALGDIANDVHGNELWIGYGELSQKARTTKETITRTLPRFIGDGLLARLSPEGNLGVPVRYRFLMPDRPLIWRHRLAREALTSHHPSVDERSSVPLTNGHTELKKEPKQELKTSSEGDYLCLILADLIESNGSKRPTITDRWRTEAEKMIRLDGRPVIDAETLIRWCQSDPFWRSNILSMPTFRVKYDQLRLRSQNGHETKEAKLARMAAQMKEDDARWTT